MRQEMTQTSAANSRKRFLRSYLAAFGAPTALLIFGYIVGRNVLFSGHGGIGWFLLPLAAMIGIVVRACVIGFSKKNVEKKKLWIDLLAAFLIFIPLTFLLLLMMPDAWNYWFIPYME